MLLQYLQDFSPRFFIKHLVFEVHLVEELGFLNLFFCDHLAYTRHKRNMFLFTLR